jgi:hypothetical protein
MTPVINTEAMAENSGCAPELASTRRVSHPVRHEGDKECLEALVNGN